MHHLARAVSTCCFTAAHADTDCQVPVVGKPVNSTAGPSTAQHRYPRRDRTSASKWVHPDEAEVLRRFKETGLEGGVDEEVDGEDVGTDSHSDEECGSRREKHLGREEATSLASEAALWWIEFEATVERLRGEGGTLVVQDIPSPSARHFQAEMAQLGTEEAKAEWRKRVAFIRCLY